ncbi:MAG: carboxypeptidase regulatory-like domain-containing protein, partial [Pirellulales bacterium]
YQVSVKLEGFDLAESKIVFGKAGETLDVGTIVLRRHDRFVAGRVVDSSGKPVDGVTVFNSGDALQPVSMVTDASGRFRLNGLFGGPVYAFARKTGYRFTGVQTTSGTADVALTLLRLDEPPPGDQPAAPPADASEHEQLARSMLEAFWQLSQEKDKWLLIRYMARIDPEQAAKWSAQIGGSNDREITIGVCERIDDLSRAPDTQLDVEDTLAAIVGLGDSRAAHLLVGLAMRTLGAHPAESQRYGEEALLRVRKLAPPERIWRTAQLGDLFSRLGRNDAGQKLLGEAADAAEQLAADDRAAFTRGMVARELANYDLPRAKKLLEPISAAADQSRYRSWLAEALAAKQLDEALAIVGQIRGDLNAEMLANQTRMKIAYRIAAARPQEALRIVDAMEGHSAGKTRAEALSWIAVQTAPRDQAAAYEMIDRSLALYLDEPDEFRSWTNYGGRPVLAAWVARQARAIGYPDMHSVVMRVLATRPTARDEHDPVRRLEASVATAWVLAFSAPATARDLLRALVPASDLVGSGHSSVRRGEWLNAWALADPERAKQIFERELAAVRDTPNVDLQRTGLLRTAEMLSQPQSEWPRHLLINFGPFWLPGEE